MKRAIICLLSLTVSLTVIAPAFAFVLPKARTPKTTTGADNR